MAELGRPVFVGLLSVCVFCIFIYYVRFHYCPREGATEIPATQTTQLLRAMPTAMTSPPPACTCAEGFIRLSDHIPKDQYNETLHRRAEEYKKYKMRTRSDLDVLLFSRANSPLQYPIQGVIVHPLTKTTIPGNLTLTLSPKPPSQVSLRVSSGVLGVERPGGKVEVTGNGEKVLTLEHSSLVEVNNLLARVTYTSTIYRIRMGELAHFLFENHEAVFPIVIQQPSLPTLYDIGKDINSQVTITTKTFIRYRELNVLLTSIRHFYKDMKIIIADDSFEPENIPGENIERYIMPPAKGWFAGRNLVISQVTTKYFLWVDDDFLFTENTKIERLVEVMEATPELDVVGGSVAGERFFFSMEYEEGDTELGGCLKRKSNGRFHALPGFPQCILAGGVVNFFLARTDTARKVGFDPKLQRVAHSEFFMDGLGTLLVASCGHVSINHQGHSAAGKDKARYNAFRHPKGYDQEMKLQLHFYKNHLQCLRYA